MKIFSSCFEALFKTSRGLAPGFFDGCFYELFLKNWGAIASTSLCGIPIPSSIVWEVSALRSELNRVCNIHLLKPCLIQWINDVSCKVKVASVVCRWNDSSNTASDAGWRSHACWYLEESLLLPYEIHVIIGRPNSFLIDSVEHPGTLPTLVLSCFHSCAKPFFLWIVALAVHRYPESWVYGGIIVLVNNFSNIMGDSIWDILAISHICSVLYYLREVTNVYYIFSLLI